MNPAQIVGRAASLGVSLRLDGSQIKIRGPRDARDAILAEVVAYKHEIAAYLGQYPVADGPFMPWCAPLTVERVAVLLDDLRATINKLADAEKWTDDLRANRLSAVARQPAFTLADDLADYRQRLGDIEAAACATEVVKRINGVSNAH